MLEDDLQGRCSECLEMGIPLVKNQAQCIGFDEKFPEIAAVSTGKAEVE